MFGVSLIFSFVCLSFFSLLSSIFVFKFSARELKNRLNTMSKAMRKKALAVTSKDKTLPSAKDEDEGWIEIVGSSKVEKMQIERQFKGLRRKKKSQVWGSPAGGYLLRDDKYLETFEEKAVRVHYISCLKRRAEQRVKCFCFFFFLRSRWDS